MATAQKSWLHQGFFVLGNDGFMPSVRERLEEALNVRPGTFRIGNFPVAANWRHTYWWREGAVEYAEAQFFAQIARGYPVLSLGVAVEKGYETLKAAPKPEKLMDRKLWDWPHLVKHAERVLSEDVRAAARTLRQPISLRISTRLVEDGEAQNWDTRAFSFVDEEWFERYVGAAEVGAIADHIRKLDEQKNVWVIVHIARDLGPAETEGLSAEQVARTLLAFNSLRTRLRGTSA